MTHIDTTIVAPATVPGTGAIGIIRVSGPDAFAVADGCIKFKKGTALTAKGYSLKMGEISGVDEVLVSIFRAPHSYTGEDAVEISCHASPFIMDTIVSRLLDAGAVLAGPGEFTQRAFINGKMDLSQAEAVADLISSTNRAAHNVALKQLKGGISDELKEARTQLVELTALMELELDFSEEEVEFADRSRLLKILDSTTQRIDALTSSFRLGNAIKNGVPVAIVGATNTGKSTLLNALLGEDRAIVSPIAGTTRDTVEELFNINGTVFRLIDTAGIRNTDDEIESIGINRSKQKILLADIIIALVDATDPIELIQQQLQEISSAINCNTQNLIVGINKIDIQPKANAITDHQSAIASLLPHALVLPLSARNKTNVDTLCDALSRVQTQRIADNASATLLTNARHYNALSAASRALDRSKQGILTHIPTDLVSQDLREALYHIGSITGEIRTDEVLGEIFSKFCIGK